MDTMKETVIGRENILIVYSANLSDLLSVYFRISTILLKAH